MQKAPCTATAVLFCALLAQTSPAQATEMIPSAYGVQAAVHAPVVIGAATVDRPADEEDELRPGQIVEITEGNFAGKKGAIKEIDVESGRVTVEVDVFGRPTLVEVDRAQCRIPRD